MTAENASKRTAAIAYLRERDKYILDGKFVPTKAGDTDVAATWAKYLVEIKI